MLSFPEMPPDDLNLFWRGGGRAGGAEREDNRDFFKIAAARLEIRAQVGKNYRL